MICPVCNAMSLLAVSCPDCGAPAEDEGRWSDWSGPYSPYEPALASAAEADDSCRHSVRCSGCHLPFVVEVGAWHL